MDEKLNQEVERIIKEFTEMLSEISFEDVEIVETKDVLGEDKPKEICDPKTFREIFLKNANSTDGYVHTKAASWSKK